MVRHQYINPVPTFLARGIRGTSLDWHENQAGWQLKETYQKLSPAQASVMQSFPSALLRYMELSAT